jgi:hypothetical protein
MQKGLTEWLKSLPSKHNIPTLKGGRERKRERKGKREKKTHLTE